MIDVGMPLREAYFNTLNGNVTVNSVVVPFADEKLEANFADVNQYVLFMEQDETDTAQNKSVHVNEVQVRVRIVDQRKSTNDKEIVESIATQILTLLFPSRAVWNVVVDPPLRLTQARYVGGQYNPFSQSVDGFTVSKTLTFSNRITQI